MALLILAAFIAVPLIEIALFIVIGGEIGLWPTLGVVVATAIVGTILLRFQGFAVARAARAQLAEGTPPVKPMLHGVCLIFAAAFLITPGFFTDAVGFLLLLPPVRALVIQLVASRITVFDARVRDETVIDGDYRDVTPDGERAAPDRPTLPR